MTERRRCRCHGEPMSREGHQWRCAQKRREAQKRYALAHPDRIRAKAARRVASGKHAESQMRYQRRRQEQADDLLGRELHGTHGS